MWYRLKNVCRFEEKDALTAGVAAFVIDGLTIEQIFDGRLYDEKELCIL